VLIDDSESEIPNSRAVVERKNNNNNNNTSNDVYRSPVKQPRHIIATFVSASTGIIHCFLLLLLLLLLLFDKNIQFSERF
jgi:predicted PurR-regulated permease PerM